MPDADASTPIAGASQPAHPSDKDRVGEELADDARIWRVYDQIARADDKERINSWNRGLDNLALFAGLFSAVTTAFIIEAQKDMKVDYAQLTFQALNASLAGTPFVQEPFVVSGSARTVTCLWVTSLLLSLSAALIAIMGKDWIGMYAGRPVCNARQWAEMRTYRLHCVERWYMSQVIASAPVLLHVSLLLFGAGLVVFIPQDPTTRHLTLGLALAAGALYLVTALSAVVFPGSSFKSPATQSIRGAVAALLRPALEILRYRGRRNPVSQLISASMGPALTQISHSQVRQQRMQGFRTRFLNAPKLLCVSAARAARNIGNGALSFSRSIPTRLLSALTLSRSVFHSAYERLRASTIQSALRDLHVSQIVLGSPWTDVRPERSVGLLSKALSWLNSISQAPEVLRAIMIALGDLEIGGEVAPMVSSDLRYRLRADIRFNWRKADFFTLSRYVLADYNLPEDKVLRPEQFRDRFNLDLEKERSLCCEDGLAAAVTIHPYYPLRAVARIYCPDRVSQPRMPTPPVEADLI